MKEQLRKYLNDDSRRADSAMEDILLDDSLSEDVEPLMKELWDRDVVTVSDIDKESILAKIKSSSEKNHPKNRPATVKRRSLFLRYAITSAAAVAIVGLVLIALFFNRHREQPQPQPQVAVVLPAPPPQVAEIPAEESAVEQEVETLAEKIEAHEIVVHVPEGETLALDFNCGSKALIEGGSRMVYDKNFVGDKRLVKLDGRAHFKVAKSEKPFEVNNDNVNIQVLGTEFYIDNRTSRDIISIRVDKGHVAVTTNKGARVDLRAGDDIVIVLRKPDEQ